MWVVVGAPFIIGGVMGDRAHRRIGHGGVLPFVVGPWGRRPVAAREQGEFFVFFLVVVVYFY